MRRLAAGLVAVLVVTGALLALPILTSPAVKPHPVRPSINELALGSVSHPAAGAVVTTDRPGPTVTPAPSSPSSAPSPTPSPTAPATAGEAPGGGAMAGQEIPGVPALTVSRPETKEFDSVGVTWQPDTRVVDVVVRIRVKDTHGQWGTWTTLEQDDAVQRVTPETADHDVRDGTSPYWTGPADGVEAIVQNPDGMAPRDVRLALINPGHSPADALGTAAPATGTAHASGAMPRVYTRAEWGADESIRSWDPEYASTIKAATIHHTDDSNNYTADQVPAMVRSIYAYHAQTRGWGDIGYNFLVDKFGRIFEGRYGGMASTVIGAHAGGFNTYTFGVSMIGNYDVAPVPQATVNAVSEIIAWKLGLYGVDPRGTTVLTSSGGGTAKYPAGTRVTLPTIFGHRDVGNTACPGQYGYARLPEIRDRVTALIGASGHTLLRTPDNPAVYVVSGSNKYLVPDLGTLEALSPLGPVGYVAQQYLDRFTTAGRQGRVVLSPTGAVYFIDAGIKLHFASCTQVADYGASCDSLVQWDLPLIDAFVNGPAITPVYRTTSGKTFYVSGGVKREVVDDAALTAAGLPTSGVRLLESGLAYLPYGPPVTRDGVVLQTRGTNSVAVSAGGQYTQVSEAVRAATALSTLPVRELDPASMAQLSVTSAPGAFVQDASDATTYLLTDQGKKQVTDPSALPSSVPTAGSGVLGLFPDAGTYTATGLLKGSGSGAVYVLRGGQRRPVLSWPDLVALHGGADPGPDILVDDQRLVDLIPKGPAQLGPGSLVYSPRSAAVYFVNGTDELVPLSTFAISDELGATRLVAVTDTDVDAYTVRPTGLSTAVDCGGTKYLGLGGRLYPVDATVDGQYLLTYTSIDPLACAALPKASMSLTRFLRADSGAIYYVENGQKRPIRSYSGYLGLGGTSANTIQASAFALSQIPTGPLL